MSVASLLLAGILFAAFGLGFFIRKVLDRKKFGSLSREIADLKRRLRGAENLLTQNAMRDWQEIIGIEGDDASEGREVEDEEELGLEDADLCFEGGMLSNEELMDLGAISSVSPTARVCIKKVIGEEDKVVKLYARMLGVAQNPPVVGERYRILLEDGTYLNTSVVTKVSPGFIQTKNSVYQIEALELNEAYEFQ